MLRLQYLLAKKKSADTYYYSNGASSNTTGDYTLQVPAGTYWVGANMWPGSGYINPIRQKVTVDVNTPATIDLTFRTADATITGTVNKDGEAINAYVSAYSEDGGYSETNANNQGSYSLSVSKGTKWHVSAVKEVSKEIWKSEEKVVDMTDAITATQDLELKKKNYNLPNSITLDDGTTIITPANSISTTATQVTISAEPTVTLAEQDDAKPLSYGYDLNATDENGSEISQFNSNITIESKYTDTMIDDSTVTDENELMVGYYDDSTGAWIELNNCSVNEDENTVTCQVDHFTKFAIVTASDTTAPSEPGSITATAGNAKVTLSWTNPTDTDFNGANIYRSTTSGTLGDKVHSAVTGTSKEDTGLTNGTAYYYTIKAVDKSGNESVNTAQVTATPSESAVATATVSTSSTQTLPKTGRSPIAASYLPVLIVAFLTLKPILKFR